MSQLTLVQSEIKFTHPIIQAKGLVTEVITSLVSKADLVILFNAWCANVANKYKAIMIIDFENDAVPSWSVFVSYYDFTPIEPPVTRSILNDGTSSPPMG